MWNFIRYSSASLAANTTASTSSPFTCRIGASIIFATSLQYSVERTSRRSLVVKPTWLFTTMCTVPPVEKLRTCDICSVSVTTPWAANAASPWISTGMTLSPFASPRRSWRARTEPSTTGLTTSRCDGLNASATWTSPDGVRTSQENPLWYLTSPEPFSFARS